MTKKEKVVTVLMLSLLGLISITGIAAFISLTMFPGLIKYMKYTIPVLNILVIAFMIFSKDVIIGYEKWARLHLLIKVTWWISLLYNMYQLVRNVFELI